MSVIIEISVLQKPKQNKTKQKQNKISKQTENHQQMDHFEYVPEELHPCHQCTYVIVLKAPPSSIAKLLSELPSTPAPLVGKGFILVSEYNPYWPKVMAAGA